MTNVVYLVALRVEGYTLQRVRAIAVPDPMFVLGRNVLNHFTITLRGKDQTFDIADP
jgi:hypothetical protein